MASTDPETWKRQVTDIGDLVAWTGTMSPPRLGGCRLVCVDGPAGAGKSTLARAVLDAACEHGTARLVHTDDLLDGWSGLPRLADTVERDLLAPLREGRAGSYLRYDWHLGRFTERHRVDPVDMLVLEGVGAGAAAYADSITTLVWVDAPEELRLRRCVDRDGEGLRDRLVRWMADEQELFARERTRQRADVLVDGTGTSDRPVVLG